MDVLRLREEKAVLEGVGGDSSAGTGGISCPRPLAVQCESVGVIGNAFCSRFLDPLTLSLRYLTVFPRPDLTVHSLLIIDSAPRSGQ